MNRVMYSSKTEEWATPQAFFDELDKEFSFTLDPCATKENAKCARYFTKETNGLLQSWKGETVFCNPPYGREIGKWVAKAYAETLTGGGGKNRCYAYSRSNGYGVFPRFYLQQTRNTLYTRTVTFQRKQSGRTVPVNDCRYASDGRTIKQIYFEC